MKLRTVLFLLLASVLLFGAGCNCGDDDGSGDDENPGPIDDDSSVADDSTDDTSDDTSDDTEDDTLDDSADDTETSAPVTTADPAGGVFGLPISITLTSEDDITPVPIIYYTTDGTVPEPGVPPTQSGSSPVTVNGVSSYTVLKFFAVDESDNREATKTEIYRFDYTGPSCTANPTSGNFSGPYPPLGIPPLTVQITCLDAEDPTPIVYYTLDGTDPDLTDASGPSPVDVEIPRTKVLKFMGVDQFGNQGAVEMENYGIYWWDDFEEWTVSQTPGSPWTIIHDPWSGTIPTVETLLTAPGGKILQIIDDNISSDGIRDTWGTLKYKSVLPWPDVVGFQADMRLRADNVAGWGSFYKGPLNEPWRVTIFFQNGNIEAWDQSLNSDIGGWVVCLDTITIDQWYAIDIVNDRFAHIYSVNIDGAPTPCVDLHVHYDFLEDPGLPSDVNGVKFTTVGDAKGTAEFDNFRVYEP